MNGTHYAIIPDPTNQPLQKQTESLPLDKTTKKMKHLGIFLIALGVILVGATVLIGIKFHSYKPFSQNYHYLGLSVIALGGGSLAGIMVYKGVSLLKKLNKQI